MSLVHPVIVRSALFCTVWSCPMLVAEAIGDQIELAYPDGDGFVGNGESLFSFSRLCKY